MLIRNIKILLIILNPKPERKGNAILDFREEESKCLRIPRDSKLGVGNPCSPRENQVQVSQSG